MNLEDYKLVDLSKKAYVREIRSVLSLDDTYRFKLKVR
jgi:hypothetical protein